MALFNFHYLQTSFFIANWIGWYDNVSWTFVIYFLFQMIYFLAGGDISDQKLFWGWQTLIVFFGVANSLTLHLLAPSPKLLQFKSSLASAWWTFLISLVSFVASQLLYAYFPPLPSSDAGAAALGLLGTLMLCVIILVVVWYTISNLYYGNLKRWRVPFFGHWIWMTIVGQLLFYIALSGLDELWVAMIAGGGPILIGLIYLGFKRGVRGAEV